MKREHPHTAWREDAQAIRDIFMRDWDPIGAGVPEDEYDNYIGPVYRILLGTRSEEELIDFLFRTETETIGLNPVGREHLRPIAQELLKLNVSK
jgi:hypothetical protein